MELVGSLKASHLGILVERKAKHSFSDPHRLVTLRRQNVIDINEPVFAQGIQHLLGFFFWGLLEIGKFPGRRNHMQIGLVERQGHIEIVHLGTNVNAADLGAMHTLDSLGGSIIRKLTESLKKFVKTFVLDLTNVHPLSTKKIIKVYNVFLTILFFSLFFKR